MADEPVGTASMSHLSIGEVLALLLEEFPDITISKIRFLESQGLIDPERTPSGYRKFYDGDVELLRCILREQRENYLPLRVIKDRLDSGEIDPTSEIPRPRGIRNIPEPELDPGPPIAPPEPDVDEHRRADQPPAASSPAPARSAARTEMRHPSTGNLGAARGDEPPRTDATDHRRGATAPSLLPGVVLSADELCSMTSLSRAELESLTSYGVVAPVRGSGGMFGEDAVEIGGIAKQFLAAGFDARHLRGWKVAADREAGLFEQMIQPLVRQRNPQARAQAREQLAEMEAVGGRLRSALMRAALRTHFDD